MDVGRCCLITAGRSRLCDVARGCDGSVRQELAAGIDPRCPWRGPSFLLGSSAHPAARGELLSSPCYRDRTRVKHGDQAQNHGERPNQSDRDYAGDDCCHRYAHLHPPCGRELLRRPRYRDRIRHHREQFGHGDERPDQADRDHDGDYPCEHMHPPSSLPPTVRIFFRRPM